MTNNAACLVSYTDKTTNLRYYLMVRHKQNPKRPGHVPRYMFAGGNVNKHEMPITAALRELKEETDLKIKPKEQPQFLRSLNHGTIHLYHLEIDGKRSVTPLDDVGVAEFICEKDIDFNNRTIKNVAILDSNFEIINQLHLEDLTKRAVKTEQQSSSVAILKTFKPTAKSTSPHPLDDDNHDYQDSINSQLAISLVDARADQLKLEAAKMSFLNPDKYTKLNKAGALDALATNLRNCQGNYHQTIIDARRTNKILDKGKQSRTKELLDSIQNTTDPMQPRKPRFA